MSARLDDRCWRCLDGTADAGDIAALDRALGEDPAAAARAAAHLRLHRHLASRAGIATPNRPSSSNRPRIARTSTRRPQRAWPWVAAVLATCAAALAVALALPGSPTSGWLISGPSGERRIDRGEVVSSGPAGARLRRSGEATSIRLAPGTRLRVAESGDLGLLAGTVDCEVAPQRGRRFAISTPHAEVAVVGTAFSLAVAEGITRCRVVEGVVRFRPHLGTERTLAAGDRAVAPEPAPAPAAMILELLLVDADTGLPIPGFAPLRDGAVIVLSDLPTRRLNIVARTGGSVGLVRMTLDGDALSNERRPPWTLAGNDPVTGRFHVWVPRPGRRTVTASAFAGDGSPLATASVVIEVVDR